MPSNDDRKTRQSTPDFLTGRGGEELEPITDPAESFIVPDPALQSAADVVDDLLSDDGGRNGGAMAGGDEPDAPGPAAYVQLHPGAFG